MQRILSLSFIVLFVNAIGGIAPAVEARTNLNGTYAFTQVRSCTVANSPFDDDPSGAPTRIPATGVVARQVAEDSGITTFNADGTGTTSGRSSSMNISNTTVGASILSITEFSVPFTYTVNADNTVDINNGVTTFATVLGGGAGNTGTVDPRSARLTIGNGANTLVRAPRTEIEQETLHFNNQTTQYRLCTRSVTLVKM